MATPTAAEELVATVFSTEAEAKVFYTELRSAGPEDRLQARCADVARAFLFSRTSGKWDHFDVVVFRSNGKLKIRATCKTRPASQCETVDFETAHQHGVSNWNRGIKQCLASRGEGVNTNVQPLLSAAIFDNALFMLSIVLHVAISKEAFAHVDPQLQTWLAYSYHVANMNAILGSHDTVKRLLVHLHRELSVQFGAFLVTRNRGIRLVIDGWTAPSCISVLGVVVMYEQDGVVHRHILKFIKSKGRHGKELAVSLHECVEEFKISHLVRTLVMDNASNCNKMAVEYKNLNDSWWGPEMRVPCFTHILQLVMGALYTAFLLWIWTWSTNE